VTSNSPSTVPSLSALARPSGTMSMVAMDQRESLRTMYADAGQPGIDDLVLVNFKLDVARELGPFASAFLIDREYGFDTVRGEALLPATCSLILAADDLTQEPGGIVEDTELDAVVASPDYDLAGVAAIKLLIIWRRDGLREHRVEVARRFIELARERGVLSVLEPVVRATQAELDAGTWDSSTAIREAARELSALRPDLYKVQVPMQGKGTEQELLAECELLNASIATPWVVLSQGVSIADFPTAVRAACRAGASGFLAGRGLWSDVVGSEDVAAKLREVSVPRLQALGRIVDELGRPWDQAR
jgi:sulfofructosephosphate aldolase